MTSLVDRLPASVRRFAVGRWPWLWLGLGASAVLLGQAAPAMMDEADLREQVSLQRALVEKQEALGAQAPSEEARAVALRAWWAESAESRFRGASLPAAVTRAQERVREVFTRQGLRLDKLEVARTEPLTESPAAALLALTVTVVAERMEPLAEALASAEGAGQTNPAPWMRVGNITVSATGVRFITGVKMEGTIYVVVEGAAG